MNNIVWVAKITNSDQYEGGKHEQHILGVYSSSERAQYVISTYLDFLPTVTWENTDKHIVGGEPIKGFTHLGTHPIYLWLVPMPLDFE